MPINSFIQEDPSTPGIQTFVGAGTGIIATANFSPPGQTLLLAMAVGGYGSTTTSVAFTDSTSGTWTTAVTATGASPDFGVAKIAYRYLTTAPGSMNVTATYTNLGGGQYFTVRVLNGASPVQGGATATRAITTGTTACTTSITTTQYLSVPYMIFDQSGAGTGTLTAAANTTLISAFNDSGSADAIQAASAVVSFATGNPGATTLGFTSSTATNTTGNLAMYEVLPAHGPLQVEMVPPSTSIGFASNF